jgi:hypothetical protein
MTEVNTKRITTQCQLDDAIKKNPNGDFELDGTAEFSLTLPDDAAPTLRLFGYVFMTISSKRSSRVVARDSSRVEAWDSSSVEAWDSSSVVARLWSRAVSPQGKTTRIATRRDRRPASIQGLRPKFCTKL